MSRIARVRVTAVDIERGRRLSSTTCPVARAMSRVVRQRVTTDGDNWSHRGLIDEYPLPTIAKGFIEAFDAGVAVEPITFLVTVPDE